MTRPKFLVSTASEARSRFRSLLNTQTPKLDQPSPTFFPARNANDIPRIPDFKVFKSSPLAVEEEKVPSISQAAVHLALLEVFSKLKEDVIGDKSDVFARLTSFFGGADIQRDGNDGDGEKKQAEKDAVWKGYIELSVPRFETWWMATGTKVEGESSRKAKEEDMDLPTWMLPPLDVLMIWHSYMLNPRCYYDDCHRMGIPSMLKVHFPWKAVNAAINLDTLEYSLPQQAEEWFQNAVEEDADPLTRTKDFTKYEVCCPSSGEKYDVLVTNITKSDGWNDQNFSVNCHCSFQINHDALCAERLRSDITNLLRTGATLRGASATSPPFENTTIFITDLVKAAFIEPPTLYSHPTMASLHEQLHATRSLSADQGQMLRQTLSCYVPTSPGGFASLSLADAVIRQGSFVEKMHTHLWLRSPALFTDGAMGTLPRAQHRYGNFFALFGKYPGQTMVPTLDVDLFWHSHQLSPSLYFQYCKAVAGRFIDHDDKLSTNVLDTGFDDTTNKYEREFDGEAYGGCFCWHCELEVDDSFNEEGSKWWQNSTRKLERKGWEARVKVAFFQECEKRRREGGESIGWSSLRKVLDGKQ